MPTFTPLETSFPTSAFGNGRSKSDATIEAESFILQAVKTQEEGGKNKDGTDKVPGIALHEVATTEEGVEKYATLLRNAASNLKVKVLVRKVPGSPFDLAIRVEEKPEPTEEQLAKRQAAAAKRKATNAAKKAQGAAKASSAKK